MEDIEEIFTIEIYKSKSKSKSKNKFFAQTELHSLNITEEDKKAIIDLIIHQFNKFKFVEEVITNVVDE